MQVHFNCLDWLYFVLTFHSGQPPLKLACVESDQKLFPSAPRSVVHVKLVSGLSSIIFGCNRKNIIPTGINQLPCWQFDQGGQRVNSLRYCLQIRVRSCCVLACMTGAHMLQIEDNIYLVLHPAPIRCKNLSQSDIQQREKLGLFCTKFIHPYHLS